jgi:hypothetical protein
MKQEVIQYTRTAAVAVANITLHILESSWTLKEKVEFPVCLKLQQKKRKKRKALPLKVQDSDDDDEDKENEEESEDK